MTRLGRPIFFDAAVSPRLPPKSLIAAFRCIPVVLQNSSRISPSLRFPAFRYRGRTVAAYSYKVSRLQLNFLRPVRKLVGKQRCGARVRKAYDAPRTPYQRLIESGLLDQAVARRLGEQFLALNPAELQRRIELALRAVWACAERAERRKVG